MIGRSLAHYQVISKLGEGGMGEVYRARDTKLDRDVAIKVLPEEFTNDEGRLARFEREAKLLASLNHPNIASIYGFEQNAIVLELVEGPTLAERIAQGRIPVDEAVAMAKQIAEALEAGHEAGVIHRDLKPANIKLKEDGTVKVLDYGLAKAFEGDSPGADAELSQSPTLTRQGTQVGVILGTAAYMSPEQAKGKRVDKRTDIFAFGAVLYEMLTGTKAFPGADVSEVLAAVIKSEPEWSKLPAVPANVDRLLRRCLDKDAKRRLRDIGEARLALESGELETAEPSPPRRYTALFWAAGTLGIGILVGAIATKSLSSSPGSRSASVVRFDIRIPQGNSGHLPSVMAFTEDESQIVFARAIGGKQQLYRRSLDGEDLVPIEGTEGGSAPFLSPDGDWLGFHADGKLKKVRLRGGPAATLCETPSVLEASWGDDDRIVYANDDGLWEVSGAGGVPRALMKVSDDTSGRTILTGPEVLPGSRAVLYTESVGTESRIDVLSLETGAKRILVEDGAYPRFAAPAHLVFIRGRMLWAVAFDPGSLELAGEAVPVLEDIHTHGNHTGSQFAISGRGSLAYSSGVAIEPSDTRLAWVDRSGGETALPQEPADYLYPRLSPDGRRVAAAVGTNEWDIWVLDVDRSARTRLTFGVQGDEPAWTPDGRRIAFRNQVEALYWKAADGTGDAEPLLERSSSNPAPTDFSPDGRTLLYCEIVSSENRDIWTLTAGEEPKPFVATSFNETAAKFSPDGRWVAYVSNESGRDEVYVRPYPGPGAAIPISTEGGSEPVWSPKGGELFFRTGDKMMAIPIRLDPKLDLGVPEVLFEGSYRPHANVANYDVTGDGQRFVMVTSTSGTSTAQIHVVLNWTRELEQLVGQ